MHWVLVLLLAADVLRLGAVCCSVWTIPNHNATQVALYGTISAGCSVYLAEAPDAAVSPCQVRNPLTQRSTERHTWQESSTERHRLVTHCLSMLCQDQGYRLWLTADGILDSQGLSAGAIWAVCYNETGGVGYDAGIRVRRSRVVQVSGHTGLL